MPEAIGRRSDADGGCVGAMASAARDFHRCPVRTAFEDGSSHECGAWCKKTALPGVPWHMSTATGAGSPVRGRHMA